MLAARVRANHNHSSVNDYRSSPRTDVSRVGYRCLVKFLQSLKISQGSFLPLHRTFRRMYGSGRYDDRPSERGNSLPFKIKSNMKDSAVVPAVSRDCLPFWLGIESASGLFIPIIHHGSEIPFEGSEVLTPTTDDRASRSALPLNKSR
jgi:hypothetical protein